MALRRGTPGPDTIVGPNEDNCDVTTDAGTTIGGLFGLDGADQIFGGARTDFVMGGKGADKITGSAGDDAPFRFESPFENISRPFRNGGLFGEEDNDFIDGGAGNDLIRGGGGDDTIIGGNDSDCDEYLFSDGDTGDQFLFDCDGGLYGGANNDKIYGGRGSDLLDGQNGNDILRGGADDDRSFEFFEDNGATYSNDRTIAGLRGGGGDDKLYGEDGDDDLDGGIGNDLLVGGLGKDKMTGGTGADDFDFNFAAEIGKGTTRDVLTDFLHLTDDIDLRTIDANGAAAGNTAFSFLSAKGAAFTGIKGQLHWFQQNPAGTANDKTIIEGDINGDKKGDFQIELTGLKTLTAADFFL